MPSVYVKTLGCKVNTFDAHALENQFIADGYHLVKSSEQADVTVVNTCSVTANADKEARYLARRLRRDSPETVLVYTGCYAQTDSALLVGMDEIDFVVPNEAKDRLVTIVAGKLAARSQGQTPAKLPDGVQLVTANRQSHFKAALAFFDRADSEQTRAFVKVQDGCNSFCTYCLIPYARGASRSVPAAAVVGECRRLVEAGVLELVLTGIHIGDYGRDLPEYSSDPQPVLSLLRSILAIPGLARLRISSLEPGELTPELARLLGDFPQIVCDHLHLPLQSGSDRILKLMRRSYDSAAYSAAVASFRQRFPEASIGADVLPGFPSETAADFAATRDLVTSLELAYLHVFPYSERPNTAAKRMPGHLDPALIKDRAAELRQLSTELAASYGRRFIGRSTAVLWEQELDGQGHRLGRTRNYLSVAADQTQVQAGQISSVVLKGFLTPQRLLGRVVPLLS